MEVLLMYLDDHLQFDSAKVKKSFRDIDKIVCINEADWLGDNLECISEDETHIRLSGDHEFLAIQGRETSSIYFAFEIQKKYGGRFHLTDPEGHFDLIIDGHQKFEDVRDQLKVS